MTKQDADNILDAYAENLLTVRKKLNFTPSSSEFFNGKELRDFAFVWFVDELRVLNDGVQNGNKSIGDYIKEWKVLIEKIMMKTNAHLYISRLDRITKEAIERVSL